MTINQSRDDDKAARIQLAVRFFGGFATTRDKLCNAAAINDNTICGIGVRSRPNGQWVLDPGSQTIRFMIYAQRISYSHSPANRLEKHQFDRFYEFPYLFEKTDVVVE